MRGLTNTLSTLSVLANTNVSRLSGRRGPTLVQMISEESRFTLRTIWESSTIPALVAGLTVTLMVSAADIRTCRSR